MKAFVGITDREWFDLLSNRPQLDEVNFWQPSGNRQFRALAPGELFLFKLHSPEDFIVGGGIYAHSSLLPISLAWESFGISNGARNLTEMRTRVEKYRKQAEDRTTDYTIGCILLEQPFFLPPQAWIPIPSDWKTNIVQGRGYDLATEPGLTLWNQLQSATAVATAVYEARPKYGEPVLTFPRLGQGSFRVLVTDAYERRCAVTSERTLPALDAAHIKPYSESGLHLVSNGILLRRDLHALFDKGYVTVTPMMRVEISRRIKEEFENGRDYYRHHGAAIRLPNNSADRPCQEFLEWHNTNIYRG
ncbi:MAG TPA: HNH endonuclease [Thermoanaerobaculia bacterium]|nr:HNH endonuclease [Thermoanaerobaculia bacterium]